MLFQDRCIWAMCLVFLNLVFSSCQEGILCPVASSMASLLLANIKTSVSYFTLGLSPQHACESSRLKQEFRDLNIALLLIFKYKFSPSRALRSSAFRTCRLGGSGDGL